MTVEAIEIPIPTQKGIPRFNKAGNKRKKAREGSTSQKIDLDRFIISSVSTFSKCIQSIASKEVSGNDAIMAPNNELLLAISLTRTMTIADITTLNM
jgi:hypothetical protein